MTDKVWAVVGRIAVAIGGVAAFIATVGEIHDRLRGADIEAAITFRDTEVHPAISKALKETVAPAAIENALSESQANNEDIYQLRERMEKLAKNPSPFRFDIFNFQREAVEITLINTGPDVADNVRLLAASAGYAVVVEQHSAAVREPIEWSKELTVGPVKPGERLVVTLWLSHLTGGLELRIPPGIVVDHTGRSRPVYEARMFYGTLADSWAWFLALAWVTRAVIISAVVLLGAGVAWLLIRKGFWVLRPSTKVPAEQLVIANRKLDNAECQDEHRVKQILELEKEKAILKELLEREQKMSGILEGKLEGAMASIERVMMYANAEVHEPIGKAILQRIKG